MEQLKRLAPERAALDQINVGLKAGRVFSASFQSNEYSEKKEHGLRNRKTRLHAEVHTETLAEVQDVGAGHFVRLTRLADL